MFDFSDRVVMVTGAAGNLGESVARAFHDAGATLVLADRNPSRLEDLFPEWVDSEAHWLLGPVDATDPEAVHQAVEGILSRFGRIDVLANTVGGYRAGTPVHETPLEAWDFMLALNARTAFVLSRAVVPPMLRQGRGKIVHVASRAGLEGGARAAAYSVAKSAVIRLVESLAAEHKRDGLNINCVLPGTIDTPENRKAMPKADHSRWVPPEAIAAVMLFLASDVAWPINGAAVPVYGQS
jgi:NAD(P)-dependent dehydrogenase (short-subunit alcohol dehydrogenase family)